MSENDLREAQDARAQAVWAKGETGKLRQFLEGVRVGSTNNKTLSAGIGMLIGTLASIGCSAGLTALCVVPVFLNGL